MDLLGDGGRAAVSPSFGGTHATGAGNARSAGGEAASTGRWSALAREGRLLPVDDGIGAGVVVGTAARKGESGGKGGAPSSRDHRPRGKGDGKGKAKSSHGKGDFILGSRWNPIPETELARVEENRRAVSAAATDAKAAAKKGQIPKFFGNLATSKEPLSAEAGFFWRGKSLVSFALLLPAEIARKARVGLPSASKGGLKAMAFFELSHDDVEVALPYSKYRRAVAVLSTQQESMEAVADIVEFAEHLLLKAQSYAEPLGISHLFGRLADDALALVETGMFGRAPLLSLSDCSAGALAAHALQGRLLERMQRQRMLHEEFVRFLDHLPLEKEEQDECERRGLPPSIAFDSGFRTWPHDTGRTLARVPAIRSDTGQLAAVDVPLHGPGLFIPARNAEGLITGLQFRLRTVAKPDEAAKQTKSPPRYLWMSRDKSMKGATGFMPFFCVTPRWSCRVHQVALVEGGLKAYAFAHLASRFAVVGASGGQWHQCGPPLLDALARLVGWGEVFIFADAGAVRNWLVILDYLRTLALLQKSWGAKVSFVWWGQEDKVQHLDPDDHLLDLRDMARFGDADGQDLSALALTPAEFWRKVTEDVRTRILGHEKSRPLLQSLCSLLELAPLERSPASGAM